MMFQRTSPSFSSSPRYRLEQTVFPPTPGLAPLARSARVMSAPALDPSTPITLVSREGVEFTVTLGALRVSGVLSRLFASADARDFEEQRTRTVQLRDVSTAIVRKIVEYCEYRQTYEGSNKAPPPFEIAGEDAIELLMTANFLDV